jgi:hypothetical protein
MPALLSNNYICLLFPLSFFLFTLPIVSSKLTGALVALFGLGAGVGESAIILILAHTLIESIAL